jgi:hypothetical protein
MPKGFPKEFREDVIRVCRDFDASTARAAKDIGREMRLPEPEFSADSFRLRRGTP